VQGRARRIDEVAGLRAARGAAAVRAGGPKCWSRSAQSTRISLRWRAVCAVPRLASVGMSVSTFVGAAAAPASRAGTEATRGHLTVSRVAKSLYNRPIASARATA
jgi:hypothetical protein